MKAWMIYWNNSTKKILKVRSAREKALQKNLMMLKGTKESGRDRPNE